MAKLIVFLFIIWYLEIGAQQPQVVQRTFATTQFDLDPNLPSEEFRPLVPTVFQSVFSQQQQLPLEVFTHSNKEKGKDEKSKNGTKKYIGIR